MGLVRPSVQRISPGPGAFWGAAPLGALPRFWLPCFLLVGLVTASFGVCPLHAGTVLAGVWYWGGFTKTASRSLHPPCSRSRARLGCVLGCSADSLWPCLLLGLASVSWEPALSSRSFC